MKIYRSTLSAFSALTPACFCFAVATTILPVTAIAQEQSEAPVQTPPPDSQATDPDALLQDEIIVTGQRGSIRNSIAEKRLSDSISDSLSADQADRFPDNNLAEALARIPGVSFQRQNDTGDGQFISIRGLDSAFNTVLFNGLRAGTANTFRRTPLDIVTGDNVSNVKITKSPLPEDSSEGIGGVVDIRTRGPLERRRDSFFIGAETSLNSFDSREGYRVTSGFTKKFGNTFGINFNVAFRERFFSNITINPATVTPELLNPLVFTGASGVPVIIFEEDNLANVPTNFVPIENFNSEQVDYEFNDIGRENLNISGAVDWRVNESTVLTFGGRFSRSDITTTQSTLEFDADTNGFIIDATGDIFDEDEGDDILEAVFGTSDVSGLSAAELTAGLAGVSRAFNDPEVVFEAQIEDEIESQARLFLRGETEWNNWDFNYVVGWARAFEDDPTLSIDFIQEFDDVPGGLGSAAGENAQNFAPFDLSGGEFVAPVPGDLAVFQLGIDPFCVDEDGDPCGEIVDFDEAAESSLENVRYSARFDTAYNFQSGIFDNIKFGFQWELSEFTDIFIDTSDVDDTLGPNGEFLGDDIAIGLPDNNATIGSFGIFDGGFADFEDIGNPFADIGFLGIPQANGDALRALRATFAASFNAANGLPNQFDVTEAEESFYSAYVQGKAVLGKLDVIGGVRVEFYEADFSAPQEFSAAVVFGVPDGLGGFTQDSTVLNLPSDAQNLTGETNFEVLPRLALNYNLTDQTKLRFGFSTALARPDFDLLAAEVDGDITIELADGVSVADATLADVEAFSVGVDTGNPNLETAYAISFDLSAEHYFDADNAITVAGFYKTIEDFTFTSFATDLDFSFGDAADLTAAINSVPLSAEGTALIDQLGGIDALFALPQANVDLNQPQNTGRAEVYGVEFSVFHTATYLPGLLSNLGFTANLTLQDTNVDIDLAVLDADDLLVQTGDAEVGDVQSQSFEFFNSPNITGNVAIFYQGENLETTLSFRSLSTQLEEVEAFGISQFQQGRGFLDLDVQYQLPDFLPYARSTTVFFRAQDLTDNGRRFSVFETRGTGDDFSDFASFNGRTFTLGVRARF